MRKAIIAATVAALLAAGAAQAPAVAQTAPAASDWRTIAPENLLVIDASKGRVLVELIPGAVLDVPLYWQVNRLAAERLGPLTRSIVMAARHALV